MNEVPIFIEVCLCIITGCATAVFVAIVIHLYMSLIEDWYDWKEQWKEDEEDNNEAD